MAVKNALSATSTIAPVKRIDRLTLEQVARMPEWVDRWVRIGLSTEPTDWERFERGARAIYGLIGLQPPVIVRVSSPLGVLLGVPIVRRVLASNGTAAQVIAQVDAQVLAQVGAQVGDQVGDQVGAQVTAQVLDQVRTQVSAQVLDQVTAQVLDQVGDQVLDQVRAQVNAQVLDQVRAQVNDQVRAQVRAQVDRNWIYGYIGGQFWIGGWGWWYSDPTCVSFFTEVCGLDLPSQIAKRAEAYRDTVSSAGWWWPEARFVVVSARPVELHRDDRNRLHSAVGPAIQWADGWSLYCWHGVRVPKEVITAPDTLSVERIQKEANAEVRRVMMERYGWERYAHDAGARLIHRDDWGTLWELPEGPRVVEVINATREPDGSFRHYWLAVARDMNTALDAVASTWRLRSDRTRRISGTEYAAALVAQS